MRSVHARGRERGATFIYAVLLMGAIALVLGASLDLTASVRKRVARDEDDLRWRYALGAASERTAALSTEAFFSSPSSETIACGGVNYDVSWGASADPHILGLAVTAPNGQARTVTAPQPSMAIYANYGLFVGATSDFGDDAQVGTAGSPGHAYFGQYPKFKGGSSYSFFGAVDAGTSASSFANFSPDRAGPLSTDVAGGSLPSRSSIALYAAANSRVSGGTLSNYNFGAIGRSLGHESLVYSTGDVTISGIWRGRGTVYSTGKVTIQAPLTMSVGKLVVMTNSDVVVSGSGRVDAFIFAGGKFESKDKNNLVTLTGAAWCGTLKTSGPLSVVYDSEFWYRPETLNDFYLPPSTN